MRNIVITFKDGVKKVIKATTQGDGIGIGGMIKVLSNEYGIKQCPDCKKREKYLDRLGKIKI
jgi:hypothetical protein